MSTRRTPWVAVIAVGLAITSGHFSNGALGVPGDPPRFAHAENVGWLNFLPAGGPGVDVTDMAVSGFAYGENIGWINFSPAFGGVANDGTGRLSGFAWGENVGWINLAPPHGGVFIDACGDFNGHAWGENVGWISFRSDGPNPFKVRTPWVSPVDAVAPDTTATTTPALAAWNNTDVDVALLAADCGTGAREIRYRINGGSQVVATGSSAALRIDTEGVHTVTYFAVDGAGNIEPPRTLTARIDKTSPDVVLNVPASGGRYFINQLALADYTISDALSGVAGFVATASNRAPIDTSSAGSHTFNVRAVDHAGNVTEVLAAYTVAYPGNIDPAQTGAHFAYGENIGWLNLRPGRGPGITVTETAVSGFAWGQNIGWINLSPANGIGGVTNDGAGNLAGYGWSENAGWISFSCSNTSSCDRVDFGVRIDANGRFTGHAWGENVGWIRFSSSGAVPFGVETSWISPDATPPVITCPGDLIVGTDAGRATAVVSYTTPSATDDRPGVVVTSVPHSGSVFPLGTTTVLASATDAAGNTSSCSFAVTVNDTEPPVIAAPANVVAEATSPAGAVLPDEALGVATATDNVLGVIVTRSGLPSGNLFPLGITVVTHTAVDASGNSTTGMQEVLVRDTTPPVITITSPTNGPYVAGQAVAAAYTCSDSVSPIAICAGPVPTGGPVDTSAPGTKDFRVAAADAAGNQSAMTASYAVSYGVCLLYDPDRAARAGSTIPIRLQLCDAEGRNLSRADLVVAAVEIVKLSSSAPSDVVDAGNANPDDGFRFDPGLGGTGGYIFNLKTTGLTTGTYALAFRATGDPATHAFEAVFQVK